MIDQGASESCNRAHGMADQDVKQFTRPFQNLSREEASRGVGGI